MQGKNKRAIRHVSVVFKTHLDIGFTDLAARIIRRYLEDYIPASTVPSVPPVFVWRAREKEVVVIYETIYGGTTLLPDGLALAVNLTNDNIGPHNPGEIDRVYEKLEKRFPQAEVRAGNCCLWPNTPGARILRLFLAIGKTTDRLNFPMWYSEGGAFRFQLRFR